MLEALSGYVKNIAVFIIFMGFVRVVAPDGKYKGYVNLTLGFILTLLVLSPILKILSGTGGEFSMIFSKTLLDSGYVYDDEIQNQMILDKYHENLKEKMGKVIEPYVDDFEYSDCSFVIGSGEEDFGVIYEISLVLSEKQDELTSVPAIYIEKIRLNNNRLPDDFLEDNDDSPLIKNLQKAISDFYNVTAANIYITIQKMD